ncbi:hypothetical protein F3Y22_tig00113724pilonHSYRG00132 [Hibiscus syriacus]|uniref:Strictosidine synthase conserved region domain-containing protein n=1 Tax=Hibiscus syriacus TaxID=106335 RepID=A0A6A2WPM0_HIBSY|nr:hypothetical protein F3Y22_tig00113724pilonHSYRG00132 [Hibiscus syriacus]
MPTKAYGLESMAFESGPVTGRFYVRIAGFLDFGFTSPNRSKRMCDGTTDPDLGPTCGRPLSLAFHYPSNKLNASKALNTNDTTGRLLMYDPNTDRVTVLMKNLSGPAGVAISQDGAYVLVSNFIGNNTIRYWLRGPRANTYDSIDFQERPDNIRRTVVGDFWRAAAVLKQPAQSLIPVAQRIDVFGRASRTVNLEAWYGNKLISEVQEIGGELYVGSRFTSFVGVYRF